MTPLRRLIIALAILVQSAGAATAQGFSYEFDNSGKGAVLCAYAIYVEVQAATKACGWERGPGDDAVDRAISSIEAFIIANNKAPITQEMLDAKKEADGRGIMDRLSCQRDPGNRNASIEFVWMLRTQAPEQIEAGTADMLSVPREPRMNPCL